LSSPLDYVAQGWLVFPCYSIVRGRCNCAKGTDCESPGKHPRTHNGVKDASNSPDVVSAWVARWPESNWAVGTGAASGIIVIDIDPRKDGFTSIEQLENDRPDGPLPLTLRSTTGGAGRHLFYTYPVGEQLPNRNNWMSGVDVKSNGGYVILPESNHISGGTYHWENWGQPTTPLPPDILESLRPGAGGGSSTGDLPDTDSILQGVEEGARDDTLFRAACRWRRQLGDNGRTAAYTLARQAAAACSPAFPQDQADKCVDQAWNQDHTDETIEWLAVQDAGFHGLTDLGNAMRIIDNFGDRIRYVEGWGWMSWTDTGWVRHADRYVAELSHDIPQLVRDEARNLDDLKQKRWASWSKTTESAGHLEAMVRIASKRSEVSRTTGDFDSEDHWLNCSNGIVNLKDGSIRMIDQDDLVTKNTRVPYEPTYKLDAWENFLKQTCDGDQEMMDYLQRAAGYTLTGSNREEAFFIISGPPASGKSTFLDALHAATGTYATSTQSETFMYRRNQTPPANELARFAGARMVSVSEIKEGESFDESLIKQFTGGDQVVARFLYQDAFEYRPQMKLWIATNHDPDAKDEALWRRIKKVSFRRAIPHAERDPHLKEVLQDPYTGGKAVLAWAVRGAMQWYEHGLQEPASVTMEVHAYRDDQDRFKQFISDCLDPAPGHTVVLNEMYEVYKLWCRMTNEFAKRQPQFVKSMESRGVRHGRGDSGKITFKDYKPKAMSFGESGVTWG